MLIVVFTVKKKALKDTFFQIHKHKYILNIQSAKAKTFYKVTFSNMRNLTVPNGQKTKFYESEKCKF